MPGLGYVRNMIANTVIEMQMPAYLAYRTANQKYADQFADQFAKWMACNELANDPRYQGKEELSAEEKNRIEKNAEALAENFRSSQGFQEMFKPDNVEETVELFCGKKETWKGPSSPEPLGYDTVRERFLGKLKRFDEQREEKREEAKDIVERLKGTTSKSFTGKLKSFFVGNSKEYDKAFKAMQDLSVGKATPEQAKEAIRNYLDIRKDKVRDHEYGRDRFKLMMQGLQSVMEPKEFAEYCKGVDNARNVRSKGNYHGETVPEDYYPTRSGQENMMAMMQDAKDKQPTMRDAARMAAVYRLTSDDPERVIDPEQIRREADNLENNETFKKWYETQTPENIRKMMSSTKGFDELGNFNKNPERVERNWNYLNALRDAGKNMPQDKLNEFAEYAGRHPAVRGMAEKIIKDKGLNIKLPDPPKKEQGKGGPDKNVQNKTGPDKTKQSDSPQL